METALNPYEARVLGVLIEKAFTTPDQYPLSLNATTNACNQKSCRQPVVDYTEAEVLVTLKGLRMKHLGGGSIPAGSRVERWHHSAREHWKLSDPSLAVLAELLLRGPQSAAALRSHAHRMRSIPNQDELTKAIGPLEDLGLVTTLAPGRGSRVAQYAQTLTPAPEASGAQSGGVAAAGLPSPGAAAPGADAPAARTPQLHEASTDEASTHGLCTHKAAPQAAPAPPNARPAGPSPQERSDFHELAKKVQWLEQQLRDLADKLGEPLSE